MLNQRTLITCSFGLSNRHNLKYEAQLELANEEYSDDVRMSIAAFEELKDILTYEDIMWNYDIPEVEALRREHADIEREKKKYMDSVKAQQSK